MKIKGIAMGTPMAVNFANIFMNRFETDMLNSYENQFGIRHPSIFSSSALEKTLCNFYIGGVGFVMKIGAQG